MGPVANLKSTKVTNNFKNLINDLLDSKKINTTLQKKLNKKETDLFELLIKKSGLSSQLEYVRLELDVEHIIHQFELLRGELVAGNTSILLKEELIEVIQTLNDKSVNRIPDTDAKELIEILKEK
jgi:hypothetical protein